MTDAEKVREGPLAVLADVLFYDPADRKRLEAALDSVLTELAEAKGQVTLWQSRAGIAQVNETTWRERAEKAEEEREEWRKAFQGKQLYPISEMEQKLAREQGKREDAEARIQELEAALNTVVTSGECISKGTRAVVRLALAGGEA